eukprot:11534265-Alexandrium_andersonii.AAC.1
MAQTGSVANGQLEHQCPARRGCGLSLAKGPSGPLQGLESASSWRPPSFSTQPAVREARHSQGWARWLGVPN